MDRQFYLHALLPWVLFRKYKSLTVRLNHKLKDHTPNPTYLLRSSLAQCIPSQFPWKNLVSQTKGRLRLRIDRVRNKQMKDRSTRQRQVTSTRRRKRQRAVGESDADSGVPEGSVETVPITEIEGKAEGVQQQQMRWKSTRKI
jgi:hypothetical protein